MNFIFCILISISRVNLLKDMRLRIAQLLVLCMIGGLAIVPVVSASPTGAYLNWNAQTILVGGSTTAMFGMSIGPECPVGQTWTGSVTVTMPDRTTIAEIYGPGPIPCGLTVYVPYPSGFTGPDTFGTAATNELGTYTAVFAGMGNNGANSFSIAANFTVVRTLPPPLPVPEFGAPTFLVAAVGLVLVAVIKRSKILNS
jgi:hypothetical protein